MATKQLYATKDFKYGTRMMRAGDPVEMTGPHQRLYRALGAVSYEKPKRAAAPKVEAEAPAPVETAATEAPKPKVKRPARRKKTA